MRPGGLLVVAFAFLWITTIALPEASQAKLATAAKPRINTEAWEIKEDSPHGLGPQMMVIFRLSFGQTHQRLFFATQVARNSNGVLTQESRAGHSAASITAAKAKSLTKLLSDFTTETSYAKPGKYWSCLYPLDFTIAHKTTLRRCREMLSPAHKRDFSKIVRTLSIESKR